jgi:putative hemolysin
MEPWVLFLFILLFALSAFFSWTEIALMSLPVHKVDTFIKNGRWWAKSLKYVKVHSDKLLITILIGNNLVNTYVAALATQISIDIARNSWIEQSFAIGLSTGIITFLILMFWDIIPKSYSIKNAEKIVFIAAYIYKFLIVLLYPLIVVIEFFIKLFTWTAKKNSITGEEIEVFLDMGKDSGTLDEDEHERIKNILGLWDMCVEDIMTPRVDIEWMSDDITVKEAYEYYMSHTRSRIPVYKKNPDKIHSILTIRDLLKVMAEGKEDEKLNKIVIPNALKIPLNQPIDKLLEIFQKSHRHIAIVLDEYGWVAGLITLEDIIEQVFWEIRDETDKEHDEIKKIGENLYTIDSSAIIDDVLEEFDLELKHILLDDKDFSTETVSYILTDRLERFPNEGENISFDVYKIDTRKTGVLNFKIIEVVDGRIGKIEVNYKIL